MDVNDSVDRRTAVRALALASLGAITPAVSLGALSPMTDTFKSFTVDVAGNAIYGRRYGKIGRAHV